MSRCDPCDLLIFLIPAPFLIFALYSGLTPCHVQELEVGLTKEDQHSPFAIKRHLRFTAGKGYRLTRAGFASSPFDVGLSLSAQPTVLTLK